MLGEIREISTPSNPERGNYSMTNEQQELVAIGCIRKPVGLQGACGVTPFGPTLGSLKLPRQVLVGADGPQAVPMRLTGIRETVKGLTCFFAELTAIEQAEPLRDALIYVPQKELPKLHKDEFFHFELQGMRVITEQGVEIGTVVEVHNYPSSDGIEVSRLGAASVMIPLVADVGLKIDRGARTIQVNAAALEEIL